ncbi:MAG: helix-hairpin-helix domain-containing protein [Adlercreutzia equolifaciens]
MAFQDSAESLAEKLHLSRVPRPVFAAIALVLALVVALAVFAFATSPDSGFKVTAASDETAAQSAEDAGEEEARADGAGGGSDTSPAPAAADEEDVVLPAGGDATARRVCIHVDGCVAAPGVYYLEAGSRVIDAVTAAGGATGEARTDAVNLAQEVQDGRRDRHPVARRRSGGILGRGRSDGILQLAGFRRPVSFGDDGLVNINTATAEELETLKGVGAATAEKIIADREANGPFKSIDDLTRVSGIGEKKLSAMRDRLCL